jgi:uroporphyrinogen decarboxylase
LKIVRQHEANSALLLNKPESVIQGGAPTMADQFTGKERVMAAIKGERLDRVPISFHIPKTHEFAGYTGMECVMEPDKALEAQVKAQEILSSDIINVSGDPFLPTTMAALAKAKSGSGKTHHPKAMLADKSTIETIEVRDPRENKRYAKYLEMCHKTKNTFSDCYVQALSGAPWSIAAGLRGTEDILIDTFEDAQFVHDLMKITTAIAKIRCDALIETGVGLMFAEPSASCSVISPKIYKEFIHPYLKELIDHFKSQDGLVDLHICGFTDPNMEDIMGLDIDIYDADNPTSLENTVKVAKKRAAIRGNISAEIFQSGTPEDMDEAVKSCMETAASSNMYILAQGCSIPYEAPVENIEAFYNAGIKYGTYQ